MLICIILKVDTPNFCIAGKRVHGLNWIVMWDKIEGAKYENEIHYKKLIIS